MSNISLTKKWVDEKTGKTKYTVFELYADDSIEHQVFDTWEEAKEFERKLLGEQEKQSNE